jgi:hypothetical protein
VFSAVVVFRGAAPCVFVAVVVFRDAAPCVFAAVVVFRGAAPCVFAAGVVFKGAASLSCPVCEVSRVRPLFGVIGCHLLATALLLSAAWSS